MSVRNAVFVDVENLNVVYKLNDKFVTILSYADNIERLSDMSASLGTGYDVYLCMKPRMQGDGDIVLNELSVVGMPFTAVKSELLSVLKFFHGFHGVNGVYLCNWVHNYVALARVRTFDSVCYYGSGIVKMEVDSGDIKDIRYWADMNSFSGDASVNDETYGDVGLLDVDCLRAQYPEVSDLTSAALTSIGPLLQCYKTPVKLNTAELFAALSEGREYGSPVEQKTDPEVKEDVKEQAVAVATETQPFAEPMIKPAPKKKKRAVLKPRSSILTMILVVVMCCACAVYGAISMKVLIGANPVGTTSFFTQADERVKDLMDITSLYRDAIHRTSDIKNVYDYCLSAPVNFTIVGFDYAEGNYYVRYNCVSPEESTSFVEYIASSFTVESASELGATTADGQQLHQYMVVFG